MKNLYDHKNIMLDCFNCPYFELGMEACLGCDVYLRFLLLKLDEEGDFDD